MEMTGRSPVWSFFDEGAPWGRRSCGVHEVAWLRVFGYKRCLVTTLSRCTIRYLSRPPAARGQMTPWRSAMCVAGCITMKRTVPPIKFRICFLRVSIHKPPACQATFGLGYTMPSNGLQNSKHPSGCRGLLIGCNS